MNRKVVSIVGPTAVGKSKLGVEVCKAFDGEVISGDSMQIYKGMDIGTAKITNSEAEGVPHHMIDIKYPDDTFSAAEFQARGRELIEDIFSRGKVPVIVGGTGMYIQGLLYDYSFSDTPRDHVKSERLARELEQDGKEKMHERLTLIDPDEAERVHPNNTKRVLRALEIYEVTGKTKSEHESLQQPPFYDFRIIGLEMERKVLYNRIDQRVNYMVKGGLPGEISNLLEKYPKETQAMKAIGYKELIPYLEGEKELEEAVALLQRNSRRYAKRQYTYFKNKLPVEWYEVTEENFAEKVSLILSDLEGFLMLPEK
ncbi:MULTISPECIES: tRNA (adenosine(37)-N6)-dimethylallyltransferase MiaA [Salimicrobium]|uniref:tRNA dimethylallyltransferase n=1 Tax=Salimicrobium humidisoli TaxID=2029857 RepID=A0ABX4HTB0_9BACI|nr:MULTISPECIES: tRNA (adenosine(37)-N6)-dimethylallyltransferase MiaA [Salimicrobium]PBB05935.1 tRNA (adenosine(37)-N6)-dimethylallyltransferase MiaA [Salimicrobium humidisoli]